MASVMRRVHLFVRMVAITAALAVPLLLLVAGDGTPRPQGPAIRLHDSGEVRIAETRLLFAAADPDDARPAAADAPPDLVGIAGRLPHDAVAMLRLPDGSVTSVGVGGTVAGWRLTTIAADRVGLARAGHARVLVLPPAQ